MVSPSRRNMVLVGGSRAISRTSSLPRSLPGVQKNGEPSDCTVGARFDTKWSKELGNLSAVLRRELLDPIFGGFVIQLIRNSRVRQLKYELLEQLGGEPDVFPTLD